MKNQAGLQVALPSLLFRLHHAPDINIGDVIFESSGRNVVSLDAVLSELDEKNEYQAGLEFRTLGLGIQFGKTFLSLQHKVHFQSQINYPKELAELVWNGNSQYVGQEVEFGPEAILNSYHDLGLGVSYQISDKLSVGGRLKLLSGIGTIKSKEHHASLYTSDDVYQLTFDVDYQLQTSSILEINGLDEFNYSGEAITFDNFISKNIGLGLDLGIEYQLSDRIQLAASVVDIGKILWKENTNEFVSQGVHTHEGIDLSDFFSDEEVDFNVQLDTVKEIFGFEKMSIGEIETSLPTALYVGGTFKLNDQWKAGCLFRNIMQDDLNDQAVSINLQYQPANPLSFGVTFSYLKDTFANLGLMGLANLGPVQIFGATDNVLSLVDSGSSTSISGRLGLALMIK
ncbi:MAG: hypothetical protein HKN16_08865 [Saprospiraceae bacterium]|nr:hypothetical protein [Saprospiraceae bacterium]